MPKQDDVVLTSLEARVIKSSNPTGAMVSVVTHNVTDEEIPDEALTIAIMAEGRSNQSMSAAAESFYVPAIEANGTHTSEGGIHLDPGDWEVWATLFDSATNEVLASHAAIEVHIPGYVDQADEFDGSQQYEIGVHIERVERLGTNLYRVHYLLANNGTTTVPSGMLVRAMIVENDDTLAWQDYHFEEACPPGAPDPKYLTLEGSKTFEDAAVYVIADPAGPSEASDAVRATVSADGKVEITR